ATEISPTAICLDTNRIPVCYREDSSVTAIYLDNNMIFAWSRDHLSSSVRLLSRPSFLNNSDDLRTCIKTEYWRER
ncbi:unnamed protein product, partial [Larinioides sclopetarius]